MTKAELTQLKEATRKLSKWESSGKAFGHFTEIKRGATTTKKSDKIYEFYCLLRILKDLSTNYDISLVPGTPASTIFPQAPSNKRGWPYFTIKHKTSPSNRYQVCYGTNIRLTGAPLTTIAPDISFQTFDATDDPDESMVKLIMDAKFKYDTSSVLPVEQVHAFIQRVTALKTTTASRLGIQFNRLTALKSNCLLTNGLAVQDHAAYCMLYKIKQVSRFDFKNSRLVIVG